MKKVFILYLFLLPFCSFAQLAYTPKCSPVYVFPRTDYTPAEIAYSDSYWTAAYPSATLVGNSTTTYNCHDYAWNKSDGGGTYWMNTPLSSNNWTGDDTYWTDGSYVEVPEHSTPLATKVSYASDDHSAITTSNPNVHISKWGAGPLMQHAPNYTPYDETTLKYYSIPITGDRFICSGSSVYTTFTATGISSYTWTPESKITPSSQTGASNSFTAAALYQGVSYVQVSMSSTCSNTTVTGARPVNLGNGPMIGGFPYSPGGTYPDPACVNSAGNFQVLTHPTFPTAYGYWVNLVWSNTNCYLPMSSGSYMNVLWNGPAGSTAMVKVEAYGPCGLGENATVYVPLIDCGLPGQDWRVYPNPVRGGGSINIQLPFKPGKNAVLQVYDQSLMKRKEIRVQSNTISLSLAGLPTGPVYLTLIDGDKRFKKIVIKE